MRTLAALMATAALLALTTAAHAQSVSTAPSGAPSLVEPAAFSQPLMSLDRKTAARYLREARAPQIVGGSPADPGEYPWMAWLVVGFPDGPDPDAELDMYECNGSVIGDRWLLTAGHCVLDEASLPTAVFAFAAVGVIDLSARIPDENFYDAELVIHFGYDPLTGTRDFALVRLDRPVPDQGIVLVRPGDEDLWAPDTMATIAGWGVTSEEGPVSDVLLEAQVPIVDDPACEALLQADFNALANLCAGFPQGGVDACFGDSGGPLMVPTASGRFVQAGIVSGGIGCARPNLPGIYTRVGAYSELIVEALRTQQVGGVGDPAARTGRASSIKRTSANVGGLVNPNGLAGHAFIELGRSRNYGRVMETAIGSGHADVPISTVFRGLKRNKLYHFRVAVSTSAGYVAGADRTFRTKR